MGIPSFFRKVITDHPETHMWKDDMPVDNLLIDFNSMIYGVISSLNKEFGTNIGEISSYEYEQKLITKTIERLQYIICGVIRPSRLVYIAVDGPPPFAKMIQQRARRYKAIKEQEFKQSLERKYKMKIPGPNWDKSSISPGTIFMNKLAKQLVKNIQARNFQIHNENITVVFNSDSLPGEGEHKLLPCLKRIGNMGGGISGNTVIYSPDADLIILSVMSEIKNIYILREVDNCESELKLYKDHEFLYLCIDACRTAFCSQLQEGAHTYKNVLADYTFLTFLCGNDFVMAAPFLKVKEGGIDLLIDAHKEVYGELNQYLIYDGKINNVFLTKLIKYLSVIEEDRMKKWQKKRDRVRMGNVSTKRELVEEGKPQWEIELIRFSHEEYYSPFHPQFKHLNRVFDRINYFEPDWVTRYNNHFFGSEVEGVYTNVKNVCADYYKSLVFCLDYYHFGVPSWTWGYKHRAAPTMKDFSEYLENGIDKIIWEHSVPYTPFEQLMYILPLQSFSLLPRVIKNKEIEKMYPKNFILDILQGTKFIYSEPILPDTPFEMIKKRIADVEEKFSILEKERNTLRTSPYVYKRKPR